MKRFNALLLCTAGALTSFNTFAAFLLMRSAINERQKARYFESENFSICESKLQKKHP